MGYVFQSHCKFNTFFPKLSSSKSRKSSSSFCSNQLLGKHLIDNVMPKLSLQLKLSRKLFCYNSYALISSLKHRMLYSMCCWTQIFTTISSAITNSIAIRILSKKYLTLWKKNQLSIILETLCISFITIWGSDERMYQWKSKSFENRLPERSHILWSKPSTSRIFLPG